MEKLNKLNLLYNRIYYNLFIERFSKIIDFKFEKNIYRWDLIKEIIKIKKMKSYLEIGCDDDLLFSKIPLDNKIGVDPVSGGNIRLNSDDFFKQNMRKFDLIFIDGLHYYDQVKKDIKNSLDILNPSGLILLHDCLPSRMSHQAIPRYRGKWTGDVWKAIVEYRMRPDLNIYTCIIDMGISIIEIKNNENIPDYEVNNFKQLKFKDFYYNYPKYMIPITYSKTLKKLSEKI